MDYDAQKTRKESRFDILDGLPEPRIVRYTTVSDNGLKLLTADGYRLFPVKGPSFEMERLASSDDIMSGGLCNPWQCSTNADRIFWETICGLLSPPLVISGGGCLSVAHQSRSHAFSLWLCKAVAPKFSVSSNGPLPIFGPSQQEELCLSRRSW